MLSRTADHLFWMARYIERAENTARMLDVTLTTSLLPQSSQQAERGWRAMLGISELQPAYDAVHATMRAPLVLDFMVRDPSNPSSIYSCLQAARENARAVRGVLTTDLWETHNYTWLQLQTQLRDGLLERDPKQFFEWVKFRSHLSRGVTIGTMLMDEAFYFARLGTFLERADNTARILDVKFHELGDGPVQRSATETAGSPHYLDYYYWAAVLRSVSAFEIYRRVYRDVITPMRVADLLILRRDMPRSLAASVDEVCGNLEQVKNDRSGETSRRAGLLGAELRFGRIEDLLAGGMHAFLTGFLERVNDIGERISQDFLVPLDLAR
ncbi:MAG TPA: alpha-E domain-containing protein [Burkholderiaceae bacterium]|nr:alpha-E domain-containing protein [Burkholderiaceae bacterium]